MKTASSVEMKDMVRNSSSANIFKSLKQSGKVNAVKKLGGVVWSVMMKVMTVRGIVKKGSFSDHHFFLCHKAVTYEHEVEKGAKDSKKRLNTITEEQRQFLGELSPEMAHKCKMAFSNATKSPTKEKPAHTKKKVDECSETSVDVI